MKALACEQINSKTAFCPVHGPPVRPPKKIYFRVRRTPGSNASAQLSKVGFSFFNPSSTFISRYFSYLFAEWALLMIRSCTRLLSCARLLYPSHFPPRLLSMPISKTGQKGRPSRGTIAPPPIPQEEGRWCWTCGRIMSGLFSLPGFVSRGCVLGQA